MSASVERPQAGGGLVGRAFVSPIYDFMIIGGGFSLVAMGFILAARHQAGARLANDYTLPLILLCTSTHFAASTVRLYTKPGSFRTLPMMTMAFPAISLGVALVALQWPDLVGRHLFQLYLSWSPYHYAAQTFGLASMYTARAGVRLEPLERRLLHLTCMLPFAHSFLSASGAGLGWLLPPAFFVAHPALLVVRDALVLVAGVATFAVPVVLIAALARRKQHRLPHIVPCLLISNGVWWVVLTYQQAFFWATIFHGLQYLSIVIAFHLKDHPPALGVKRAWLVPTLKFYGSCLVLAYLLFAVWPYFFTWLGFAYSESVLVCVAVINLHHFIVDRGIWQIRKDPGNRQAVAA
jgi:hypothetical protein